MKKASVKKIAPTKKNGKFLMVGVGASAGGLESFSQLLAQLPEDANFAVILVQHLDPSHPSLATEIFNRTTKMVVTEVKNGERVKPNHIYVLPANKVITIESGVLKLKARGVSPAPHKTADAFFQSLAADQGPLAIGVVLSGTGNDGTEGLRAIRSEGGITFAETPKSAKFDGMPSAAINAGVVDLILTPEGIAEELVRISTHSKIRNQDETPTENSEPLLEIMAILKRQLNVDFSQYKVTTLHRRVERRMVVLKQATESEYAKYLKKHPEEAATLFAEILIHVTSFFRDPKAFIELRKKVFPQIVKRLEKGMPIRIWVPGCSTGEEAYSIAISLLEFLGPQATKIPIQIFGSDISETAIKKARTGMYPDMSLRYLEPKLLQRYFTRVPGGFKISKSLRELCLFSRHDVNSDPPFARIDLISCRNLLIYFTVPLQKKLIPIFHYALKPGGFLFLGQSETVGSFTNIFRVRDNKNKIYEKKESAGFPKLHFSPTVYSPLSKEVFEKKSEPIFSGLDVPKEVDRIIALKYGPSGVVVNDEFDVLSFRGRTVPYLEQASGVASHGILKMAHPDLVSSLRSALKAAKDKGVSKRFENLQVAHDREIEEVNIEVIPINPTAPKKEQQFLVLFEKSGRTFEPKKGTKSKKVTGSASRQQETRLIQLEKLLEENRRLQQALTEDHEATVEEATAASEELQSTNEELQSTNEELETAKEELQSTNEELTTVNEELQNRNAELSVLNNDLVNLLGSIEIPILIIGADFKIRRFTPNTTRILNLIPSDIGRPVHDIRSNLNLPNLDELVSEVMRTLVVKDLEVKDRKDHWFRLQVRPYRTTENKIDGVVMSFVDIEDLKLALDRLKGALEKAESIAVERNNLFEKMQIARDEAEKANRAKDVFLATLSHELRTPLSSILIWAQLIQQGKVDLEKARSGAAVIEQSARTQSQLIDDLLDISRIITGKLALNVQKVDPSTILPLAIESVRANLEKKAIKIVPAVKPEKCFIMADPVRLQQIIWNLLTNAVKFSPKDSKIEIKCENVTIKKKNFVRFIVRDYGKGIPVDFIPHLFDRFSQADSSSTRIHGGLGLGLSIVRSLVELQGGTVSADNAGDGTGAVFTVTFPIVSDTALETIEIPKSEIKQVFKMEEPVLDKVKILIVDDDENTLESLDIYLKSYGAVVSSAASVKEALSIFGKFKPEILISDIAMPDEDGYSLIRKIRAMSREKGGKVTALALTAYASDKDEKKALEAGFDAHIGKPVEVEKLIETIVRELKKK